MQLIFGDLREIGFSISNDDENDMINEVEVFYHMAADVRFDENITDAILANARGMQKCTYARDGNKRKKISFRNS